MTRLNQTLSGNCFLLILFLHTMTKIITLRLIVYFKIMDCDWFKKKCDLRKYIDIDICVCLYLMIDQLDWVTISTEYMLCAYILKIYLMVWLR
jgi:hypothetical protein